VKLSAFDALYARAENFEEVYDAIATKIVTAAKRGAKKGEDVFYAVPGHPLVGERSVRLILERAAAAGVQVRIVSGLSFVEPVLEALATHGRLAANDDPMARLQLSDALDLAQLHHPPLDPDRPALVAQIFSRAIASDVKLTLLNQYPPAHEVMVVRAAGSSSLAACDAMPLAELDHGEHFDHLTSLYIPALSGVTSFEGFQETIAQLRAPEGSLQLTHPVIQANPCNLIKPRDGSLGMRTINIEGPKLGDSVETCLIGRDQHSPFPRCDVFYGIEGITTEDAQQTNVRATHARSHGQSAILDHRKALLSCEF
jgi:tetrapyrrole methylase family protein/MazG family protein